MALRISISIGRGEATEGLVDDDDDEVRERGVGGRGVDVVLVTPDAASVNVVTRTSIILNTANKGVDNSEAPPFLSLDDDDDDDDDLSPFVVEEVLRGDPGTIEPLVLSLVLPPVLDSDDGVVIVVVVVV